MRRRVSRTFSRGRIEKGGLRNPIESERPAPLHDPPTPPIRRYADTPILGPSRMIRLSLGGKSKSLRRPKRKRAVSSASVFETQDGAASDPSGSSSSAAPSASAERAGAKRARGDGESPSGMRGKKGDVSREAVIERRNAAGCSCAEAGDMKGAIGHWRAALALQPKDAKAEAKLHEQSSQVLLEMGRTFEAISAAERAVSCAPEWLPARLSLGRAQLNHGEPAMAVQTFQKATHLEPRSAEAWQDLAYAKKALSRARVASKAAAPSDAEAWRARAILRGDDGKVVRDSGSSSAVRMPVDPKR